MHPYLDDTEHAMDIRFPQITAAQRETFGRYLPAVLAVVGIWLLLRGLRKSFWTLFGLYWAVRAMW
ncbi:MAG TPA: hypothetical protein VF422_07090 [Dokdonella sp.]